MILMSPPTATQCFIQNIPDMEMLLSNMEILAMSTTKFSNHIIADFRREYETKQIAH